MKISNIWKWNNTLVNCAGSKKELEIKLEKFFICMQMKGQHINIYGIQWDSFFIGKFIALNAWNRTNEKVLNQWPKHYLKLQREEKIEKFRNNKCKIGNQWNENYTNHKVNKTKVFIFFKDQRTDACLERLIFFFKDKVQITNIRIRITYRYAMKVVS